MWNLLNKAALDSFSKRQLCHMAGLCARVLFPFTIRSYRYSEKDRAWLELPWGSHGFLGLRGLVGRNEGDIGGAHSDHSLSTGATATIICSFFLHTHPSTQF